MSKTYLTFSIIILIIVGILFYGYRTKMPWNVIVDSDYTFSEAVSGKGIPNDVLEDLRLLKVYYVSFDGKVHQGQLVVHKDVKRDLRRIFNELLDAEFPIEKAIPIIAYNWDDQASVEDNNTSVFNYRFVQGTQILSNHAYGRAIDINPRFNPYVDNEGNVFPVGAFYNPQKLGTITKNGLIVRLFRGFGWGWGGDWTSVKDWQHFEKVD